MLRLSMGKLVTTMILGGLSLPITITTGVIEIVIMATTIDQNISITIGTILSIITIRSIITIEAIVIIVIGDVRVADSA